MAKKLPAANLLLLQQLLAVLRRIGQHASSSRMTCSSLAVCLGPSLLSPPQEEQLELQVLLAENNKVRTPSAAGCSLAAQRQPGCPEVPVPGGPVPAAKAAAGAARESCPPASAFLQRRGKAQRPRRGLLGTLSGPWAESEAFLCAGEWAGGLCAGQRRRHLCGGDCWPGGAARAHRAMHR